MKSITKYVGVLLLLLNVFVSEAIATTSANRKPLAISKVGLDHKSFNPSKGEEVTLNFEVNKQADVQVVVYDRLGQEMKRIKRPAFEADGHVKWDGRRDDGKLAAGNVFLYTIEATANEDERVVYNPAEHTGGLIVKPHSYTFDNKTGKIEYVLPKTCMVRLRAGLKDGMLARTIFDWEPRTAGRHTENWDGKDMPGKMNLIKHPDLDLNLTCYTLPANTIIVRDNVPAFEPERNFISDKSKKQTDPWMKQGKYLHYRHDPRTCHEPKFKVMFSSSKKDEKTGVPIVSEITQIRIELDDQDAMDLINKRFEIMLFVDGTFLFEMEEGSSPFTFHWNTKGLAKGRHILTVNVMSYDDHIGVVAREVIIGE